MSIFNFTASGAKEIGKAISSLTGGLKGLSKETNEVRKNGGVAGALGDAKVSKEAEAQLKKVEAQMKAVKKQFKDLKAVSEKSDDVFASADAVKNLAQISEDYKVLIQQKQQIEAIDKETLALQERYTQLKKASDDSNDTVFAKESVAQLKEIVQQVDALKQKKAALGNLQSGGGGGDIDFDAGETFAQKFGSFAGQIQRIANGTPLAEAGTLVADFADRFEGFESASKQAISGVKGVLGAIKSAAGSGGGGIGGVVSGLVGSLNPVGLASAAAGLALTAVSAGIQAVGDNSAKAAEKLEEQLAVQKEAFQQQAELNDIIAAGDYDSVAQGLEDTFDDVESLGNYLESLKSQKADIDAQYEALGASLNVQKRSDLGALGATLQAQIIETEDALYKLGTPIKQFTEALPAVTEARDAAQALERLMEAESELVNIRTQAQGVAEDFAESLEQFNEETAFARKRELEDRAREDTKALEAFNKSKSDEQESYQKDELQAVKDQVKNLSQLREDAAEEDADAVKAFAKESADALEDLVKGFADIDEQIQEQTVEANETYMEESLEATEDYLEQLQDTEDAYQKERRRRIEDLNDELLAAEQGNDVLAFLNAQKTAEKDLRRMAEDNAEASAQSQDEFADSQAERQEQFAEQLQDLKDDGAKQKAELQEQFDEAAIERKEAFDEERAQRKENLAEALADSKKAFLEERAKAKEQLAERLQDIEESYAEERALVEEERAFMDERRAEDLERQLEQMREANEKQLADLEEREAQLLEVIQSGGTKQIETVKSSQLQMVSEYKTGADNAVNAIRNSFRNASTGGNRNSGNNNSGGRPNTGARPPSRPATPNRRAPTAFAEGGVVERETLGLVGESLRSGEAEAVIPFKPSEGIYASLDKLMGKGGSAGGASTSVTYAPVFQVTIGDIASRAEVEAAFSQYDSSLRRDLQVGIQLARAGKVN